MLLTLVPVSQDYRRTGGVRRAPAPVPPSSRPHRRSRSQNVGQLRLHRCHQLEDGMATGRRHNDSYVFANPTSSARPSNASSPRSICPASAYTTCATPTPRSCYNKASTRRSSANASATPASHSPWTSTNTSYPACKPKPPPPSEPPSSATPDDDSNAWGCLQEHNG